MPVASAAWGAWLGWAGAGGGFERWRSDAICLSNRLEGKARGWGGEEREAVGTGLGAGRGGEVGVESGVGRQQGVRAVALRCHPSLEPSGRSEERRVGKECRL